MASSPIPAPNSNITAPQNGIHKHDESSLTSSDRDVRGSSAPATTPQSVPLPSGHNALMEASTTAADATQPLSKNQQKKLKRKQEWEDGREERKVVRREKAQKRKIKRQEQSQSNAASAGAVEEEDEEEEEAREDGEPAAKRVKTVAYSTWKGDKKKPSFNEAVQAPITFIYDCNFDDLMLDNERVSLASQLTRAYSDNRKSRIQAHMVVSSFGGKLKERFEGILSRSHEQWKKVRFMDEDYVAAAEKARDWMPRDANDVTVGALVSKLHKIDSATDGEVKEEIHDYPRQDPVKEFGEDGEVVYLTSDSPNTLTRLHPYSTYIIGGLVDKNRHKGICYKSACDRGIKTAKLPIGEFMQMQSRQVLATNHVGEIMLKWLEHGNWGKAFIECIPKRKGGTLKESAIETKSEDCKSTGEAPFVIGGDEQESFETNDASS